MGGGGGAIWGHTGGELGGKEGRGGCFFLSLRALGKKGRKPQQGSEAQTN